MAFFHSALGAGRPLLRAWARAHRTHRCAALGESSVSGRLAIAQYARTWSRSAHDSETDLSVDIVNAYERITGKHTIAKLSEVRWRGRELKSTSWVMRGESESAQAIREGCKLAPPLARFLVPPPSDSKHDHRPHAPQHALTSRSSHSSTHNYNTHKGAFKGRQNYRIGTPCT